MKLSIVTGMVVPGRTREFWASWRRGRAADSPRFAAYVVLNGTPVTPQAGKFETVLEVGAATECDLLDLVFPGGMVCHPQILGTVPAMQEGLRLAGLDRETGAYRQELNHIVGFIHDDVRIDEPDWAEQVLRFFKLNPRAGMVGFGGAYGVGVEGMYTRPFDPMSLVRHDFISNMRDAEAHGRRVTVPQKVAVLDGFSMFCRLPLARRALRDLTMLEVIHHAYDVGFGVTAQRLNFDTWMLPVWCHHAGGRTAVGSQEYQAWARENFGEGGDQEVWKQAHKAVWDLGRGVLPFRVQN
jgi:hypothetical protein